MTKIPPSRFLWENSAISLGYHVFDFIHNDESGKTRRINKNKFKVIGICDAAKLQVRPRDDEIAVLFDIVDDEIIADKVWAHFPEHLKHLFEESDV